MRPVSRPELSLPQVRELYGRFFACVQAELEANFLLHDFQQWHYRHEVIAKQLAEMCTLDATEMLRCRVDAPCEVAQFGLASQAELNDLGEQVRVNHDIWRENHNRILTAKEEPALARSSEDGAYLNTSAFYGTLRMRKASCCSPMTL